MLTIEILGQPFTFQTDTDVADARTVADFVVKSVDQAKSQCINNTPTPDKRAILILTALNISNELFDLKRKYQQLLQDIDQRSAHLLNTLETQLV